MARIAEAQGGGGGTTIHSALTAGSLIWTASGHTGTASRVAAFGGGGAAAYLEVGVDLQAYDADLDAVATLATTGFVRRTGAATWAASAIVAADLAASASASTYLRGDMAWSEIDGGHITAGTVAAARLGSGSTGTLDQWQKLGADGVWRVAGGPTVASVARTLDTTLSSTGLTMSGLPVGIYHLQIFSVHTGNATGGMKIQLVTSNGTCRWRAADRDAGTVVNTEASTPNYSVSASEQALVIDGWVNITSSTGTIDLHMAQNSSNATPTTIVRATMVLTETS